MGVLVVGTSTGIFNPHRTPIEILKRITVGREPLIHRIHESLCISSDDHNPPHWLISGPRGVGKTHLLLVLFSRVRNDPRTSTRWLVIHLSEEEYWRSYSAPTFLRSTVKQLISKNIEMVGEPEKPGILQSLRELKETPSGEEMLIKVRALLERFCRVTNRRVLIGAENFDSLYYQFKDSSVDAHRLRDFIQLSPRVSLIGTSITTDLGTSVTSHENPFYRFFRMERLERLTLEEQRIQIDRIAQVDDDEDHRQNVQQFLNNPENSVKIKIIHRLSGGNPRLGVILYGVLGGPNAMVETVKLLHELLDRNTPYFQDRMKDLAPMQRPLAAAFCEADTTLTGAEAARRAGIDSNVAYSLLTRLERAGFIEPVDLSGGRTRSGKLYQVSEDLFRMWWQYRFDSQRLVRKVVEFLAIIYETSELHKIKETFQDWKQTAAWSSFSELALDHVSAAIKLKVEWESQKLEQVFSMAASGEAEIPFVDKKTTEGGRAGKDIQKEIRRLKRRLRSPDVAAGELVELISLYFSTKNYTAAEKASIKLVEIDPSSALGCINLGTAKLAQKDYRGAKEAFEMGLQLDPSNALGWFRLGEAKGEQKDYKGAQKALEKGLQLDPSNAFGWFRLGEAKREQKDYKGAQEAFERCLQLDPSNALGWVGLGIAKGRQKDYVGALEAFEKGLQLDPSNALGWVGLGMAKGRQKDYKGALEAFEKGLQLDPSNAFGWFRLGEAKGEQKDYKGAQEALEKSLQLDPSNAFGWFRLGEAKGEQKDYRGAQEAFERGLQLDPSSSRGWVSFGITKSTLKDYPGAQVAFEKGLQLDPSNALGWVGLGIAKGTQEDYVGALEAFEKGLQLDPSNALGWFRLGEAKGEQKDYKGAQEALEKSLQLDPSNAFGWFRLGEAKAEQKDYRGAQEAFERGLQLDPSNALGWVGLGIAKRRQGDYVGALEAFEKSLQLNPSNAHVWFNLGAAKGEQGDHRGAEEAFEKSLQLNPSNAPGWVNLGITKFAHKDYTGAQEAFEKGLKLDPSNAHAWSYLARAKHELKDYKGSDKAFERAIALDPGNAKIWATIIVTKIQLKDERLSEALGKLRVPNGDKLESAVIKFTLVSEAVLDLNDTVEGFVKSAEGIDSSDKRWPELLKAASEALLTPVDINDTGQLKRRLNLVVKLSGCRPEMEALDSFRFVFEYFLARLETSGVPAGKKLTPKQRGERVLARVPREQRQGIRDLVNRIRSEAEADSTRGDSALKSSLPTSKRGKRASPAENDRESTYWR
jgi:tetratricopeptide (TPR) repeat protein